MFKLYKKFDKHEILAIKCEFLLNIITMVDIEAYTDDF